jgi:hypothetical protein
MIETYASWLAPLLLGLAFGGVAFTFINGLTSGASTYADSMS